ncbi:MAG TPA: class I SAM-dependent methyltransferase [Cyclobacteriaceae bacterium]
MSKDRFSTQAKSYATFRPSYPASLYDFIMKHVSDNKAAWDCACGNGQASKDLADRFDKVYATDISGNQVANAVKKDNIIYSISPAEKTSFADGQFDLVTVGQALHWLDRPAFFSEARRVSKPGGIVAAWGYSLLSVNKQIDPVINHFYTEIIGPYWDKERKLVDEQYKTVDFPFRKIEVPPFEFYFEWSCDELIGYLSTWSSVEKYIKENNQDPVQLINSDVRKLWGNERRKVSFPLFVLMGYIR